MTYGLSLGDGGEETRPAQGRRRRTKGGMLQKKMSRRRGNALGNRGGKRLRREPHFGNKPNKPKLHCSKQIRGFGPKQTRASYPPCNQLFTTEKGTIFGNFKCRTRLRIAGIFRAVYRLQREDQHAFQEI